MSLGIVLLLGVIAALLFAIFSNSSVFSSVPLEIVREGKRQIIRVPAGGNVQAAINRATGGDIIELQAGAVYYGTITLPQKEINDFITIRTSAVKQLPENERVSPQQTDLMAKILIKKGNESAVKTEAGAHHYRFIGIEFAPNSADYIYNLLYFGEPDEKANVPHHLEIDRCYLHPFKTGKTRRGLALNSADTIIKNSYFEGFAFPEEETQAICGWTGSKNVKIINNHIEGGAENIMFGGSDPLSAELIPSDIEISGNYITKPLEWRGNRSTKTLFELKNARRVQFVGNYLEHNFFGSAFRITVRNQNGKAPFSIIEDVLIKDNIIKGAGDGINILGKDDTYSSQRLKGLKIINNLFLDIGLNGWEGSGYFIQTSDGEDVEISNNTVFNGGNIITAHGAPTRNFVFRNNIAAYNNYGLSGDGVGVGVKMVGKYFPGGIFADNLLINNKHLPRDEFSIPPRNTELKHYGQVGFADLAGQDFRILPNSRYKGIGCQIEGAIENLLQKYSKP